MRKRCAFVFFILCCLLLPPRVTAQAADTTFLQQAMSSAYTIYKKETAENLRLYNGTEYLRRGHGAKGFPFFESPDLLPGAAWYDGNLYDSIRLQYDAVEDNVIVNDYSGNVSIRLVKNKLRWFMADGHRFDYLTAGAGLPVTGFYQLLYSGAIQVYAKREKKYALSVNAADNDAGYTSYDTWFIKKQDAWYPVEDERALLRVLADKKDALKKFIRANKLRFKKDPDMLLYQAADYYTQSNH